MDFNNEDFVKNYVKMIDEMDYDNSLIVNTFKENIKKGAKVLELGMGPALDYTDLKDLYDYTLSDSSKAFIKIFNENNKEQAIQLDAVTIDIDDKFDCIFTNKVFQCLDLINIRKSFERQHEVINKNGIVIHSFWLKTEEKKDDISTLLSLTDIRSILKGLFQIEKTIIYDEMNESDSVLIVAKKV